MTKKRLIDEYPKLAKEWHPTKNGSLRPENVSTMSGKKVWWKCAKGDDHEWEAVIANRSKGSGCPVCSGLKFTKSQSLGVLNPELAKEWHPSKNGDLTPFDVFSSTKQKVWWKCPKGIDHEWEATLNNRSNGKSCPICLGQKVVLSNCLATKYPEIAKEWHPIKNKDLTPFDVPPSTARKVWWKCLKHDDHIWQATVNHRTNGTGCPKCNPAYSIPELRIFCELKTIFPDVQHRAIVKKNEIDIFIPSLKFGIEYDGVYWHADKVEKDKEKNRILSSSVFLLRIREENLPLIEDYDISIKDKISINTVKRILEILIENLKLSTKTLENIKRYMKVEDWVNNNLFNSLYSKRKNVDFEKSLTFQFPKVASEWHPTKNGNLVPEQFTSGSGRKIWWRGKCRHVWLDSINHRTSGRDCPKCRYKKASKTRKKKRDEKNDPQVMMDIINQKSDK